MRDHAMTDNPTHLRVALSEAVTHAQLLGSRAQQLAVELFEARQVIAGLEQQLADERLGKDALQTYTDGATVCT